MLVCEKVTRKDTQQEQQKVNITAVTKPKLAVIKCNKLHVVNDRP